MSELRISGEETRFAAVLDLDHPTSADPEVAGAKAAALAIARRAGLPALQGFVLSVDAAGLVASNSNSLPTPLVRALRAAWGRLAADDQSVIVRSSSPVEDGRTSSMAGRFRSVLAVSGWDDFLAAVREVVASGDGNPMAVLVQPFLRPAWGGVLFGADPVTGRADRLVVAAVPGGPDRLVSGEVSGSQLALSPRGRLLDASGAVDEAVRRRSTRRALVRLARDAARLFGGPQDIEWAIADDCRLVLLQSRPITTIGDEIHADGPILGPGPVAETFPSVLAPLEEDLWIPPLREGLRRALRLTGGVPRRQLQTSPIVVTVQGRAAVDLDLLGLSPVRRSKLAFLDPRPPARRLLAAWRVGRLRAGLPLLATDVLATVDADLRALPTLDQLRPAKLLDLLDRSAGMLVSLHGYEVLAGQLLPTDTTAPTAASAALRILVEARATTPDATADELIARHPVLLSLTAPAIGRPVVLPDVLPPPAARAPMSPADPAASIREALRLRIRWLHELTVQAALVLGDELTRRGVLARPELVRTLGLEQLRASILGDTRETGHSERSATTEAGPLPAAFRLAAHEIVVPLVLPSDGSGGRGAGGGRGTGAVHTGPGTPPPGAVLVVPTLDPALASLLPGLGGLVAETGSVLSHLAILAREYGVPTVVDYPGATERFRDGMWVVVDGATGVVTPVENEEWSAA